MVYPVVHALQRTAAYAAGELALHVLALPAATSTMRSNGIDCLGFRDFLDPAQDGDALAWGQALAQVHHSPTIGVSLEDSVAYLGMCYKDLVLRHGKDQADALLAEKGRHAFFPLTVMERVFDRLQPDLVVTTNSPRSEAAAIATANSRGVDSIIMTDLFTGLGGYQLQARHITFLNEVARDMFVENGLADPALSTFHCTGNPAFDKILALPNRKDPAWLDLHFRGIGGRTVMLHADVPAYWDALKLCSHNRTEEEILAELEACHAAACANGVAYLVRPHPSQDRAFYERWVSGKRDAWLAAACDLHELLACVDLLVARTTTVTLEAAMMRKRVLQLDWRIHTDMPIAAMGVAWGTEGFDSLAEQVGKVLADDDGFALIQERIGRMFPSEPAAPKVAGIILERLCLEQE